MKIGIAGVGGIGSNVAMHLVRSGLLDLKIVDFDRVDAGNLNRQFYFEDQIGSCKVDMLASNLKRINPSARIDAVALKLNRDTIGPTFGDCQVVVEGFDGRRDKKDLLESLAESGLPVISACGIAGADMDKIHIRRVGNCTIVGDFATDCSGNRLYSHKVGAVAAIMAAEVISKGGQHG
jgi:sulfur carrier protein ThiS adenylyltransferase